MIINNEMLDFIRLEMIKKLDTETKSQLGQFMTPSVIASYMASLFNKDAQLTHLLDCGAGIGTLAITSLNELGTFSKVDLWEVDDIMLIQLQDNMTKLNQSHKIYTNDFIIDAVRNIKQNRGARYSHAIINPPYKKINSKSIHRQSLSQIGIETVNLYTAFLALTILLMEDQGEIVAIIPRSFCNGLYYKPFRNLLLKHCSIESIHLFDRRNKAFQDDSVLQENIIIKLIKNGKQKQVTISQSSDHQFTDYQSQNVPFEEVVLTNDKESFIHIPINRERFDDAMFQVSFSELGVNVSTGPVVDFRVKEFLKKMPEENTAPLLYPHHFLGGNLQYPKDHKKPNAIQISKETQKWLMPNDGYYVLVKRFSTKEEKRRVVAYIVKPNDFNKQWIGFENHWNFFHINKHGLDEHMALGIACFLNSSQLDEYFRTFSGHTQVNATDLKNLKYPSIQSLIQLGKSYKTTMNQQQIDTLYKEVV